MNDGDGLLQAFSLTRRYGRVTVLDQVDLSLYAGEIHALLGANGAGKSTMVRIIAGLLSASSGEMTLGGEPYKPTDKQSAEAAGVQIVQQELNLIPTLSVAENLLLTRLPQRLGVIHQHELHARARKILDRFALSDVSTETAVGKLGVGRQQMVEIAAALDRRCKVLILDEPTAALSAGETEQLLAWLGDLRDQGVGILYISHRLEEVQQIADRVTILRDGKLVTSARTSTLNRNQIVERMSGESAESDHHHTSWATAGVAMRVDEMRCGMVDGVSLTVHCGERVGIAGLVGSGRTELLRAIFGADAAESGAVYLGQDPTPLRFTHPSQATAAGVAMLTEDRKQNGVFLSQSVRVNTTINALGRRFAKFGWLLRGKERDEVNAICKRMQTRCTNIEQAVGKLSGGNQQKVALSKWLAHDARVFLLDEPTRGIDVAARNRIHRLIESLAHVGKGVLMVSSDLEELMQTCDRIAVMSRGKIVATFNRGHWSVDQIMQAAFASPDRTSDAPSSLV